MQFDTIYMKVRGVSGEAISTSNAVEAYNNLIEDVREVYANIDISEFKESFFINISWHEENICIN